MVLYNPLQLASQLKLIRNKNNLTQAQLANKIGIKQATLSNFETNPDTTQLKTFFKIIQALELQLDIQERKVSQGMSNEEDW
ncbi:type II toxin-antitoxin system antitoxin HipB [Vibrio sp. HN007]|uniref:type II toxin-antitoxin system antitoxin HipB n=1 Tax=Vibrio iocasae TaxID=3098914 RepID=UPI0035D4A788